MLKTTNGAAHPAPITIPVPLTDLGRQLLALIPRYGEAVGRQYSYRLGKALQAEAERQAVAINSEMMDLVDAILAGPDNLGDLAIACEHMYLEGASSDEHEHLCMRIMAVLLGAIGLTRERCDFSTFADYGDDDDAHETGEGQRRAAP